jgi:hypothetical protein
MRTKANRSDNCFANDNDDDDDDDVCGPFILCMIKV